MKSKNSYKQTKAFITSRKIKKRNKNRVIDLFMLIFVCV